MSVGTPELLPGHETTVETVELVSGDISARSPTALFWRRFRADRVAMISTGFPAMLARTLTQAALPSTVGVKVAAWLNGVLDAVDPNPDDERPTRVHRGQISGAPEDGDSLFTVEE